MSQGIILTRTTAYAGTSQPTQPSNGSDMHVVSNVLVPMSVNMLIDQLPYQLRASVKWLVCVTDEVNNQGQTYEVVARASHGKNPVYTKYNRIGDNVKNDVDVVDIGGAVQLKILNRSSADVRVDVVRYDVVV